MDDGRLKSQMDFITLGAVLISGFYNQFIFNLIKFSLSVLLVENMSVGKLIKDEYDSLGDICILSKFYLALLC